MAGFPLSYSTWGFRHLFLPPPAVLPGFRRFAHGGSNSRMRRRKYHQVDPFEATGFGCQSGPVAKASAAQHIDGFSVSHSRVFRKPLTTRRRFPVGPVVLLLHARLQEDSHTASDVPCICVWGTYIHTYMCGLVAEQHQRCTVRLYNQML